jgi:hypothetical protein
VLNALQVAVEGIFVPRFCKFEQLLREKCAECVAGGRILVSGWGHIMEVESGINKGRCAVAFERQKI